MKLEDLNPRMLEAEYLWFDCPSCRDHKLGVHVSPRPPHMQGKNRYWQWDEKPFDRVTLSPSIQTICWHGWIQNGEVVHG